ncbi:Polyribonucleotide nucleotidyltransferase [Desulfofarcimen acetoxidans DSM 771]|uniref:Polyribonucleotide nucleotidyltransferase n=1 Tax=Desulfofarcimen acetoxidans (strain ATCC 49208 / DSM 771 / KCTC 5769 / VKM B-1644 / 5575) TaxID=485916 RepID=C8W4N6_DESAS|nr:polyribonucleotide nucleotidyltransferase [Desulfofarcimen acetoxidans]ACV63922.1 Polyribonucleotide nucleotidyltransferase [Desulfofarcimen acetoxidans DSM 771]
MSILKKELNIGGRVLTIETGRVAKQAGGAVLVAYGDTVVLSTATMSRTLREGIDFFPLTVEYEERLYAVGRIPGGFIKREARPSENAILSCRLIDRSIRPLFPKGFRNETQIINTIMSVDQDHAPEMAAMIGTSAALTISDAPFNGPIGGVIVGRVDGELIINPNAAQSAKSDLHLVVAGTKDAVMMVEAGANEVTEEVMLDAIAYGHDVIRQIVDFIDEFRQEAIEQQLAKPKLEFAAPEENQELIEAIGETMEAEIKMAVRKCVEERMDKKTREAFFDELKDRLVLEFAEQYPEQVSDIKDLFRKIEKKLVRQLIVKDRIRMDGRALDEVRPISVEAGVLPRTHGSGLFTRGQTQILSVVTLGAISEEQILDGLGTEESKRYMHHYNFPPFSTGETKMMRSPGRREIGHGALAGRALEPMIPGEEEFPYTIRVVSEALESNGSTSMGSVCGSTLALMDAGVPIKAPVSGVAMGLIKEDDEIVVLTDIQGLEDALGDMDFKVAGTAKGINALQMDIKVAGVTQEILEKALQQAYTGRMHIMGKMMEVISAPRQELSKYAPMIIHTTINPDKIRDVIGPGGKTIKKIVEETGANIDIEDDGRVFVAAVDREAGQKALSIIEKLTQEVVIGQIYLGRVVKIMDFGCFVEIIPGVLGLPGKEGLVHISQLAHQRVNKVEDVVAEGDMILVKAIGNDNMGRLKLSKKEAMPQEGKEAEAQSSENGSKEENGSRESRHRRGGARPPRKTV